MRRRRRRPGGQQSGVEEHAWRPCPTPRDLHSGGHQPLTATTVQISRPNGALWSRRHPWSAARVTLDFDEGDELRALRAAVADLGSRYGQAYFLEQARSGGTTDALWAEAGKAGFLGVNLPEEYGGGGGGLVELSLVLEELGAAGCPLLMMVVSPAICGTVITRFGTPSRRTGGCPGWPTARSRWRSRSPSPTPGPTRTGSAPSPAGTATTGCSPAARCGSAGSTRPTRCSWWAGSPTAAGGTLRPALFVVPTEAPGWRRADPDGDRQPRAAVRAVPGRRPAARRRAGGPPRPGHRPAVRGPEPRAGDGGGLLARASRGWRWARRPTYARERSVWGAPIGAHQGLAHPLARLPDRDRAGPADDPEGRLADRHRAPTPGRPPTARSTPPPRPPRTPSTRRSRPTAATGCPRSTASPRCWRCPA